MYICVKNAHCLWHVVGATVSRGRWQAPPSCGALSGRALAPAIPIGRMGTNRGRIGRYRQNRHRYGRYNQNRQNTYVRGTVY